jgi:predicted amidophosphoribosyltransferase
MKTCPFCAEPIQDAAVVCKHCGRDLVKTTARPPVLKVRQADWISTTAKWGVGIVIAIVLLAILFG